LALAAVALLGVNAFDMLLVISSAARAVSAAVPVPLLVLAELLLLAVVSVSTGVHSSSRTVTKPSLVMAMV
jgi:hypothetical protein